jgi:invasion protein IalB
MSYRLPMKCRVIFAARMVGLGLGALAAMPAVIVGTSHSVAQQGAPKAQPKAKPKAAPAPTPTPQAQQGGQPDLTYSFWTKICQKGPEANAKQVCFLARDAHLESGMPVAAVVLVEPEGEAKKLLRVTLPLGVSLQAGTRVIIDNGQPLTGPYLICLSNGCMAEYEASNELITKMKSGQTLHVQGINGSGQPINIPMPLADFAKAYDGPPIDPKELEQQEKK